MKEQFIGSGTNPESIQITSGHFAIDKKKTLFSYNIDNEANKVNA